MNSALLGTLQCVGSVLLCLGFNNQAPQCSLVHCMALKVLRSIANKCTLCANKFKFPA